MAGVANAVAVPLDVYLGTSYQPDCDWIEGELFAELDVLEAKSEG